MVEKQRARRSLFAEISSGLQAMRYHREGRVRLRTHHVESQAPAAESVPGGEPMTIEGKSAAGRQTQ